MCVGKFMSRVVDRININTTTLSSSNELVGNVTLFFRELKRRGMPDQSFATTEQLMLGIKD